MIGGALVLEFFPVIVVIFNTRLAGFGFRPNLNNTFFLATEASAPGSIMIFMVESFTTANPVCIKNVEF